MKIARLCVATFLIATAGCRTETVEGDETPKTDALKKLAEELADATFQGDYAEVIDHTYDGVLKLAGGREKAIEAIDLVMKQMKEQGITIKAYHVGEPGEFLTEGGNTFVVIPTRMEMAFAGGKLVTKSYLLGIIPQGGKTWKFVDGTG